MKHTVLLSASAAGVVIAAAMLVSPGAAQRRVPLYDPYPDGILPPDLLPELNRVRREVRHVFDQYLQQWQALPPPTGDG